MHKFFKGAAQIAKCEAMHIVEIRRAPAPQALSVWKDPTRKIMEHSFNQRGVILNFQIYNWKLLIDYFISLIFDGFHSLIFDGFLSLIFDGFHSLIFDGFLSLIFGGFIFLKETMIFSLKIIATAICCSLCSRAVL